MKRVKSLLREGLFSRFKIKVIAMLAVTAVLILTVALPASSLIVPDPHSYESENPPKAPTQRDIAGGSDKGQEGRDLGQSDEEWKRQRAQEKPIRDENVGYSTGGRRLP